jgi:sugar phosphate permease
MNNETTLFILTTVMELATLLCAYLSARLYKKSRAVRLSLVAVPLVLNLALYAYYRTTPFFYMAIVLIICIPFAWTQRKSQ